MLTVDMTQRITDALERRFPGLMPVWNGATWETGLQRFERRLRAVEEHLCNLEDRYADIENRLNDHAQGTKHRRVTPKPEEN